MKRLTFVFLLIFMVAIGINIVCAHEKQPDMSEDLFNELKNSECSSIILQVNESHSVVSFRRDQVSSADIFIVNKTIGDLKIIEQYKHRGGDFFQVLIAENGWVICCGGDSDGEVNQIIKNISYKIIKEENPSIYLPRLQDIFGRYDYGHLLIKNPNGKYYAVFPDRTIEGKLNPGDYICTPNTYSWSQKGSFDGNPVDSAIKIASKDRFGVDRRNIITYDFKENESGVVGVDIYATNDDGSFVGIDSSGKADNIDYGKKYIKGADIPKTPNKMHLGYYVFKDGGFDFFKFLGF